MIKNGNSLSLKAEELLELKNLFNKQSYALLEEKTKLLIKKYPNVPMLFNILGISQSSTKKFNEAIDNFKKTIELDPKLIDAHNNLGIALKNKGDFTKSLDVFKNALKINSNHYLSNFNLGDLYTKFNEIEKATNCFKKSFESRPDLLR